MTSRSPPIIFHEAVRGMIEGTVYAPMTGGGLFSKLRAVDLGAAIDTVTRFKYPHVFYRLSGW